MILGELHRRAVAGFRRGLGIDHPHRLDRLRHFLLLEDALPVFSRRARRCLAVEVGEKFDFERVMLMMEDDATLVGTPTVKGARVEAEVLGEKKGEKIYVFKFKRRKNYRRKTGHRAKFTEVRITDLKLG